MQEYTGVIVINPSYDDKARQELKAYSADFTENQKLGLFELVEQKFPLFLIDQTEGLKVQYPTSFPKEPETVFSYMFNGWHLSKAFCDYQSPPTDGIWRQGSVTPFRLAISPKNVEFEVQIAALRVIKEEKPSYATAQSFITAKIEFDCYAINRAFWELNAGQIASARRLLHEFTDYRITGYTPTPAI